jgi:hypothetical protein
VDLVSHRQGDLALDAGSHKQRLGYKKDQ